MFCHGRRRRNDRACETGFQGTRANSDSGPPIRSGLKRRHRERGAHLQTGSKGLSAAAVSPRSPPGFIDQLLRAATKLQVRQSPAALSAIRYVKANIFVSVALRRIPPAALFLARRRGSAGAVALPSRVWSARGRTTIYPQSMRSKTARSRSPRAGLTWVTWAMRPSRWL